MRLPLFAYLESTILEIRTQVKTNEHIGQCAASYVSKHEMIVECWHLCHGLAKRNTGWRER